ncbi:hypothetical protein BRPE64_ACDS13350 [Caballeronia insecticola]|uniref:Uncharacterized protein n=1 Tax=Caballeronia insecticola TaxID=758793 RepID=R4WGT1_9BURK|nr:hypothetical protein BRPE64_ACDS13350 [Caballeronia insecticola]
MRRSWSPVPACRGLSVGIPGGQLGKHGGIGIHAGAASNSGATSGVMGGIRVRCGSGCAAFRDASRIGSQQLFRWLFVRLGRPIAWVVASAPASISGPARRGQTTVATACGQPITNNDISSPRRAGESLRRVWF